MSFLHDAWQWWLHYGFDGLAGGLLGGGVAAWALRRTIRHERDLRAEDARTLEQREHAAELQDFRRRIAATFTRLEQTSIPPGTADAEIRRLVNALRADLMLFGLDARRLQPAPGLEELFRSAQRDVLALPRSGFSFREEDVRAMRDRVAEQLLDILERSDSWAANREASR